MPLPSIRVRPWVFMVLILPFGVASGYGTVTLAYQLKSAGVPVAQVTALAALSVLPQTWKFFWSPVVDVTLDQRKWYLISGVLTAAGIAAMGFFPPTQAGMNGLKAAVFLASLASTVMGMACESLIAHATPDDLRGAVSGWYQAGNLGGVGVGGGLGLELAQRLQSPWKASSIVAVLCLACCAALLFAPPPERAFEERNLARKLRDTAKDLWQLIRQGGGALALILSLLPIGTGAVTFAALAMEWHASDHVVAMVTGVLAGVIATLGCLVGGWMCDRMDRKAAYVWFGLFQALAAVAMAFMPRTQLMYVLWSSIYTFGSGLAYAAFSAFVLEAIGKGAAATKYNALAALSNVPIYYMTSIDGWAHDKWDSTKMFLLEAGLAVASAGIFLILANVVFRKSAAPGNLPDSEVAIRVDP